MSAATVIYRDTEHGTYPSFEEACLEAGRLVRREERRVHQNPKLRKREVWIMHNGRAYEHNGVWVREA